MKNDKSWYEKINSIITMIAALCTILGVSVFGIINYQNEKNMPIDPSETKSPDTQETIEPKPTETLEKEPVAPETPPTNSGIPNSTPSSIPTPKQISIRDVSEFYSDGIEHRKSTITDNLGELYEGYTFMVAGNFWVDPEGSVVYRNDNQYSRFWGRVIISQSEKNEQDCGWIKIYGDDNLLLDTGTMGRGIAPIDFDFDIFMYSEIKIDFKDGKWSNDSYQYPNCYLVNTYFEVK